MQHITVPKTNRIVFLTAILLGIIFLLVTAFVLVATPVEAGFGFGGGGQSNSSSRNDSGTFDSRDAAQDAARNDVNTGSCSSCGYSVTHSPTNGGYDYSLNERDDNDDPSSYNGNNNNSVCGLQQSLMGMCGSCTLVMQFFGFCSNNNGNSSPTQADVDVDLDVDNSVIDADEQIILTWDSDHANRCRSNDFTTNDRTDGNRTLNGPAPGTTKTYTIRCTGAGDPDTDSVTVRTRSRANIQPTNINTTSSAGFDSTTGNYNSVTINSGERNVGESTAPPSEFIILLDEDRDGVAEASRTFTAGSLGQNNSQSGTLVANDVPFYGAEITVQTDSDDDVNESNENDNDKTEPLALTPPDPGLQLWIVEALTVSGDTAIVNWDTQATYPMECTVSGLGISPVKFNPSVTGATGDVTTSPLTSKGEYHLECDVIVTDVDTGLTVVLGTFTTSAEVEIIGSPFES